jgi:TonB-linked SusC/RagA family outer membrane protein
MEGRMSRVLWRAAAFLLLAFPLLTARASTVAGVIRGRVIDKETGQAIAAAQIVVVGNNQRLGAITDNSGNFTLRGAPAGRLRLRATRIGFQPVEQEVVVPADGDVTANFSLEHAVTRLADVITTATGEQSRREVGNVVASVTVEAIAKTAPITNVSEMLAARASGVVVTQNSSVLGAAPVIRVRGTTSLSLSNDPLVLIDNVRTSGGAGGIASLNPEEVESIDIIKGPSASALYGTAAANGVIIVKTKHGRAGDTRWSGFVETGLSQMPGGFPKNFWTFGRNIVNGAPVTGAAPIHCLVAAFAQKQCTIDSTTSFDPYSDEKSKPFKDGPSKSYGFQASGGGDALRFFVSADIQDVVGPYHMNKFEQERLKVLAGAPVPEKFVRPSELRQASVRGNFTFALASNANLHMSIGYSDREQRTPFDGGFFAGLSNQFLTGPGFRTATNGTARIFVGDIYSIDSRNQTERLTGAATLNWTPRNWLQVTAEGGLDNGHLYNTQLQLPGEGPQQFAWGPAANQAFSGISMDRSNALQYTMTGRVTAMRKLTNSFSSTTTVGVQWFRNGTYSTNGQGFGLGVGVVTPNTATTRVISTRTDENATYGGFLQQQLDWRERVFTKLAARLDKNSAFGRKISNTIYPSGSISYVMSDEPWFTDRFAITSLKLRGAIGTAGLAPNTTSALQFLTAFTYPQGAADVPGLAIGSIGNASLKPEVTTEYEAGFDLGVFNDRVNLETTWFNKLSRDQIFNRTLAPSFGAGNTQTINIAKVRNTGVEVGIDAELLDRRAVSWSARLSGSHIVNRLITVGDIPLGTAKGQRNVAGYPLNAIWDRPYTYADANGDGFIVPSEITPGTQDAMRGASQPLYEAGLSNAIGLFNNRLRVNALMDYRGKFWNTYSIGNSRCQSALNCETVNVTTSPIDRQAAAVAATMASTTNSRWLWYAENDFIKLREISVTMDVPAKLVAGVLRARTAQIVVSGRNLSTLWTKYPGIDPEENGSGNPPALRLFFARVNVSF